MLRGHIFSCRPVRVACDRSSTNEEKSDFLTGYQETSSVDHTQKTGRFVKDSTDEHGRGAGGGQPRSVSSSLLQRLKAESPEAWRRLVYLFGPTVYQQCRCDGLQEADAGDVVQDVFRAVSTQIGSFRRDRPRDTFRGWLWAITRNKLADYWQDRRKHPEAHGGTDAQIRFANLAANESADSDTPSKPRTSTSLYRRALNLLQSEFEERTWKAFWRVGVDGCTPAEVADEFGMSVKAVYVAKTRVLRRLREELGDLLD